MEKEKSSYKIALEAQRVAETSAETKRKEATIYAQMEADVSTIKMLKEINETKSLLEKETIFSINLYRNIDNRQNDGLQGRSCGESDEDQTLS